MSNDRGISSSEPMETAGWLKERATNLIETRDFDKAVPFLERILRLPGAGPYDLSYAHFMLGQIHLSENHYRLAQEHLRSAMDITGEDSLGLMLLGQAMCGDGKLAKARETLEKARRLNPGDEAIELSLALTMCLKREFDEAEEVYRRVLRLNQSRVEAYIGLAQSLAGQGKLDAAKEILDEAKDKIPLSLSIRLAMKDLDRLEKAHDFCDWVFEENLVRASNTLSPRDRAPIPIIRTIMVENDFPPSAIHNSEKMWSDFARISLITPRRPEAWAAAVVYTMAKLSGRNDITQNALAERLGVSPSSISIHFRAISRNLKLAQGDKRYL